MPSPRAWPIDGECKRPSDLRIGDNGIGEIKIQLIHVRDGRDHDPVIRNCAKRRDFRRVSEERGIDFTGHELIDDVDESGMNRTSMPPMAGLPAK